MKNFFKSAFGIKTKIKRFKDEYQKIFNEYAEYLEDGVYKVNSSFSVFYNVKYKKQVKIDQNNIILHKLRFTMERFSLMLKRIFIARFIKFNIRSDKKIFTGHAIYLSTLKNETRSVDFKNNTILTKFRDKNRMDIILEKRNLFQQYFNTPKVLSVNENERYIVEEYVHRKRSDSSRIMEKIMTDTLSFQQKDDCPACETNNPDKLFNKLNAELTRLGLAYTDKLNNFIKSSYYKKRICHGDLSKYNLIFDGKNYYYIDYELVGNFIFFYDILFFVFFELFRFKNIKPYKRYMNGEYDEYFCRLFSTNGAKYNPDDKKLYLFIAISENMDIWHGRIPDEMKKYLR